MANVPQSPDPFAVWREWVGQSERQWNAFLNNAMATDEFSQTLGRFMDVYVNMQKNMNDVMSRYLSAVNMPSREDVVSLGDRLTGIEERLSAIEAALRAARGSAKPPASAAPAGPNGVGRPPRTKKPATKA